MNEKLIERKLVKGIAGKGGIALKLASSSFTGLPDRLVLLPPGTAMFVEVKTTDKKPTPRQLVVHAMLRKLGFRVEVIDDQQSLDLFLLTT